jgi:hypothetical protein
MGADKKVVAAWHAAALEAGGKCNGPPGPRPQYGPKYYGAFVIDPVGGLPYWCLNWRTDLL